MLQVMDTMTGFLQPLVWNFVLYFFSMGKLQGCVQAGMWGLLFYNDNGEMMEACFETGMIGSRAEYIKS